MLGKIGRQLSIFYGLRLPTPENLLGAGDTFGAGLEIPVGPRYAENLRFLARNALQKAIRHYPPAGRFQTESGRLVVSPAVISQPPFLSVAQNALTVLYVPVLIVWISAIVWAWTQPDRRNRCRLPVGGLLVVYSYNFGNCLTIAIVHSLEVDRYVSNQLAFTLFSSAAGLLGLGVFVRDAWRRPPPDGKSGPDGILRRPGARSEDNPL